MPANSITSPSTLDNLVRWFLSLHNAKMPWTYIHRDFSNFLHNKKWKSRKQGFVSRLQWNHKFGKNMRSNISMENLPANACWEQGSAWFAHSRLQRLDKVNLCTQFECLLPHVPYGNGRYTQASVLGKLMPLFPPLLGKPHSEMLPPWTQPKKEINEQSLTLMVKEDSFQQYPQSEFQQKMFN